MMNLNTSTSADPQHTEGVILVRWCTGLKSFGILKLRGYGMGATSESKAIAEAEAIQYLLFQKKVFNRDVMSGHGIKLTLSTGALKKAAKGTTSKVGILPHVRYLKSRLCDVTITVEPQNKYLKKIDEVFGTCEPEDLVITSPGSVSIRQENNTVQLKASMPEDSEIYDVIDSDAIGRVKITKHAFDQFIRKLSTGDPRKPWQSLVGRLQHPGLQKRKLPDKVIKHKMQKYGSVENQEIWGHPRSQMSYVVVNDPDRDYKTLVTVYRRHDNQQC